MYGYILVCMPEELKKVLFIGFCKQATLKIVLEINYFKIGFFPLFYYLFIAPMCVISLMKKR